MRNNYTVYVHIFPNGKKYVGITRQAPERRWARGHGYKNQAVHRAIEKYGWDNIEHIIVAENLSHAAACEMEVALISLLSANVDGYGYNLSSGGEITRKGLHNTASHNEKIAASHRKRVCCFSRAGELLGRFESVMAAADFVGGGFRVISQCCNGDKKSAYGYVWRFEGDSFEKFPTENKVGGVKGYPVIVHTIDGELVGVFSSCKRASIELGINETTISEICKGLRAEKNGLVFNYYNADEKVTTTEEGNDEQ